MRPLVALGVAAAAAIALVFAGCGGGGGSPPLPGGGGTPPLPGGGASGAPNPGSSLVPASTTQVRFDVTFPARNAGNARIRRPAYVSPSIQSLTFSIDGAAQAIVNAPAPTGAAQTVTTTVPATPGSHGFAIAEYDRSDGAGSLLGRVAQTNTIVAGQINTLVFTVDGQLAKIAIQPPVSPFVEGTLASGFTLVGSVTAPFAAVPEDADGNTIVVPGAVPALAATSGTPGAIVASASAGNAFTLQAPAPTGFVQVSVTGTNLDGATVTSVPFAVKAVGAFYIADFTAQQMRVFDESGTPLALPASAFANLTNPEGLAFVPGAPGSIVVTQTANFSQPYIVRFDPSGAPQNLADGAFAKLARPLFLTYAGSGATGRFFVPDFFTNSVSVYDSGGAPVPLATGAFAKLANPIAAAFDTNDGQLYVTSGGGDVLATYAADGTLKGSVAVGSHPMGVAYDGNNKSLYVASAGTNGATTDGQGPQAAAIVQYSEAPAAVSNTGGFVTLGTNRAFTGIAFDPYTKQLYVADAGDSAIDVFTETGAPVPLPAGAFGTIAPSATPPGDPMAILFVP